MIDELLRLLSQIDSEDMDIELNSNVRSIRPDTNKEGTEKFEAKRRIKRLNHLLEQSDTNLSEPTESNESPAISVMDRSDTDGVRVTVDNKAFANVEEGDLRVIVPDDDYTTLQEIDLESPEITDRVVNNGITTIEVHAED